MDAEKNSDTASVFSFVPLGTTPFASLDATSFQR